VKAGKGVIKVNGKPIDLVQPQMLRIKIEEPVRLLGSKASRARIVVALAHTTLHHTTPCNRRHNTTIEQRFSEVDVRVRVKGGGKTAQIYGRPAFCCCRFAGAHRWLARSHRFLVSPQHRFNHRFISIHSYSPSYCQGNGCLLSKMYVCYLFVAGGSFFSLSRFCAASMPLDTLALSLTLSQLKTSPFIIHQSSINKNTITN
jgi:hypothetical protein